MVQRFISNSHGVLRCSCRGLQACSCEWLWFSRHSLQSMAEGAVRDAGGAARLPRLLAAFADGAALLPHCSPYSSETLQVPLRFDPVNPTTVKLLAD